jgi:hypothetical protein
VPAVTGSSTPGTRQSARDVLDPLSAEIGEPEAGLAPHLIEYLGRDADAAGLGDALQARRDVDGVAIEIVAFHDDVADVDADAKRDALLLRQFGVALGYALLNRGGAFDRVHHASELDQGAIAHQLATRP